MVDIASGMVRSAILSCVLFVSGISTLNPLKMNRPSGLPEVGSFDVYWNVPTFMCKQHKVFFANEMSKYGIIANPNDDFRGDKIVLLYDPGEFPMVVKNQTTNEVKDVNGKIPQAGNIHEHLKAFEKVVKDQVPSGFSGLAVIDFEVWRPIFRQHWNAQTLYKNLSLERVSSQNPSLTTKQVYEKAKTEFEAAAKDFMEKTLVKAKELRPDAKWGYYGFPYCLNYGKDGSADCPKEVKDENNQIDWLFQNSQAFYMSVYSTKNYSAEEHEYFVTARMNEAARLAAKVSTSDPPKVYPYFWYRHHDDEDNFMPADKLEKVLETISKFKLGGAIVWGKSGDLKTAKKCQDLMKYLTDTLGPTILKVKGQTR